MGIAADKACIQYRMLNRGKGPAVHSLRAQADRRKYQQYMKHVLELQENLELMGGVSGFSKEKVRNCMILPWGQFLAAGPNLEPGIFDQEMEVFMGEKAKDAQKMKYGFWLRSDVNQLIEDHKHLKNDDRSAFVTEAIRRYCAELDGERNLDVLCDRMYKIISAEADAHSNRIASLVFKIAVEMAIQNKLLSAGYVALTEEEMQMFEKKRQHESAYYIGKQY